MRKPNSYGSVEKLSSKRRKPYGVRVTTGWEIVDGKKKQIRKYLGYYATRKEAEIALAEYNQNPYDLNQSLIFSDLFQEWSKKRFAKLSKSAITGYTAAFKNLEAIHDMDIRTIKTDTIQKVLDDCPKGHSVKQNMKVVCKGIMDMCIQNDIISRNYASLAEVGENITKTIREPFKASDIVLLWERQGELSVDILLILMYSGMRINELLKLKCENVNLQNRTIDIVDSKTKAGIRIVPIHSAIYPIIKQRYKAGELLIRDIDGKPMSYSIYNQRELPTINELLQSTHRTHDCRVTFVSRWKELQLDSLYLKKIVGHQISDLTESVYTKIKIDTLAAELEKLTY